MKKLITLLFVFAMGASFFSCDEEETIIEEVIEEVSEETEVYTLTENITSDTTWATGSTYILGGRIAVESGATLTIEPGVLVKGAAGSGTNASALVIARGATINAVGTADLPIIFTSTGDNITTDDIAGGDFVSPNLTYDIDGLWGGLIILGNANVYVEGETEVQIEGIPTSDTNGLYGGTDNEDSSGTLAYVSIRHGGSNIGEGNEINGLTLGGVGSGTIINHIEVVGNQDDGIEWFGGTVDVSNVVIWNVGDDALDTDQGWSGTCSDFIIVTPTNSAMELDGPETDEFPSDLANHTFSNGVIYAGDLGENLVDVDANTNVNIIDIYFYGMEPGYVNGMADVADASNASFSGLEYTLAADAETTVTDIFVDVAAETLTEVAENANTVGVGSSEFGWTYAGQSGALSDLGL